MRRQACFLLAALFGAAFLPAAAAFAERPGEIRQVKAMPDLPSPFEVRDWKHVAIELDRLIFDPTAKGQW
ncbi:MAG TPA: hypothetical protein VG722_13470, partial [Tepidisphaeraceae bacterium]|nr:hypothetical protein [Tepidisphaeraceae bacterium]